MYVFNEVMSLKLNVIIALPLSNENTFTSHKKAMLPQSACGFVILIITAAK